MKYMQHHLFILINFYGNIHIDLFGLMKLICHNFNHKLPSYKGRSMLITYKQSHILLIGYNINEYIGYLRNCKYDQLHIDIFLGKIFF